MSLAERVNQDYLAAYKAHEAERVGVLRLLKTAMSNRLVELKQPGGILSDDEILELVLKQAKQRKDSIEQYANAKRRDLADKEARELRILEDYLPKPLTEAELADAIAEAMAETGAASPQEMGKMIGAIMAKYRGRVDGKAVSALVRQKLVSSQG